MSSLRVGGRLLGWVVIAAAGALLLVAVAIPAVAGGTPYVVLTGSMRPTMPPGTLVVVRRTPVAALEVGDVVTYQLRSGMADVVTHRIVAVTVDRRGHRSFRTQGDANPSPDPLPVHPVQIRGQRWYAVPYVGYAVALFTGPQRRVAAIAAATGMFLYAVAMFLSGAAERRSGRRTGRRSGRHAMVSR